MNTITHPTAEQLTLAQVCEDKRAALALLPKLARQLADIDELARMEAEQWQELVRQHEQRARYLAHQRRDVVARIGSARAAAAWLRAHGYGV